MGEIFAVLKDRLVVYATGIRCGEGGRSGQEEERCALGQGTVQEGDNGCEELRVGSVQGFEAGSGVGKLTVKRTWFEDRTLGKGC